MSIFPPEPAMHPVVMAEDLHTVDIAVQQLVNIETQMGSQGNAHLLVTLMSGPPLLADFWCSTKEMFLVLKNELKQRLMELDSNAYVLSCRGGWKLLILEELYQVDFKYCCLQCSVIVHMHKYVTKADMTVRTKLADLLNGLARDSWWINRRGYFLLRASFETQYDLVSPTHIEQYLLNEYVGNNIASYM